MDPQHLRNILESCLLVAGKAMSIAQLETLFEEDIDRPERAEIRQALADLQASYESRGIELVEVASGWRLQSSKSMEHWVGRLFQEKQPRYSRALLETLVLIAYRQPITRGEIEDVRGVAVSSNIIRTLQEREWIKEMGYKDVPGKPALWGTTKEFLDYFNLKRLDELPTLAEARDLAEIDAALAAEVGLVDGVTDGVAANDMANEGAEAGESHGADVAGQADRDGEALNAGSTNAAADAHVDVNANAHVDVDVDDNFSDTGDHNNDSAARSDVDSDTQDHAAGSGESVGAEADTDAVTEPLDSSEVASDLSGSGNSTIDEQAEPDVSAGTELMNLAASIGRERDPEPDLASLVDNFDAEPSDSETSDQRDTASATDDAGSATGIESRDELLPASDAPSDDAPVSDLPVSESTVGEQTVSDAPNQLPVEAMEISAHDIDIDEWKESASEPSGSDLPKGPVEQDVPAEPQAQTELRRVIDDFAEEHRKQLDEDSEMQAKTKATQQDSHSSRLHQVEVEEEQAVTSESDDKGVLRTRLFGIRGTVETELNPDEATGSVSDSAGSSDKNLSDEYKDSLKGEP